MIRGMYNWAIKMANTKRATWAMFGVSFTESSFFPVPPDVMLVPMVLANPKKAWYFAGICTLASVLGGLLGYAIGSVFYETIGKAIISFYHMEAKAEEFRLLYGQYGAEIILLKGLTPIPYKLVTIASGLAAYPILPFIILSAITRGARFFIIAGLLRWKGEEARIFIEKHLERLTIAFLVLIVLGFVAFFYIG
ncbi:MAG: cytochrome B [Pseudomonas fluorescens]|nr:MAG: cytochrome B [Pseudomonas fluorescens]